MEVQIGLRILAENIRKTYFAIGTLLVSSGEVVVEFLDLQASAVKSR